MMKPLLLVDGYNIIGAWGEANEKNWPIDECRDRLIHLLEDYAGYTGQEVHVVFDGYKTDRSLRSVEKREGLTVIYTRRDETADRYIERECQLLPKYRDARVATSDNVEQTIILGRGATRISARELWRELNEERSGGRGRHASAGAVQRTPISSMLTEEQYARLEEIRRQK